MMMYDETDTSGDAENDKWVRRISHLTKLVAAATPLIIALLVTLRTGLCG